MTDAPKQRKSLLTRVIAPVISPFVIASLLYCNGCGKPNVPQRQQDITIENRVRELLTNEYKNQEYQEKEGIEAAEQASGRVLLGELESEMLGKESIFDTKIPEDMEQQLYRAIYLQTCRDIVAGQQGENDKGVAYLDKEIGGITERLKGKYTLNKLKALSMNYARDASLFRYAKEYGKNEQGSWDTSQAVGAYLTARAKQAACSVIHKIIPDKTIQDEKEGFGIIAENLKKGK